jgi:hypothetical protein
MLSTLIGLHAFLGETGSFMFLWIFIELLDPTPTRLKRAKWASLSGLTLFIASWIVGGYYYWAQYGPNVKPVIKAGPSPWAHTVVMELKEHVFLFLPVMALMVFYLIYGSEKKILSENKYKNNVLLLSGSIFLVGMSMAAMGYLISTGFRASLEIGVLK